MALALLVAGVLLSVFLGINFLLSISVYFLLTAAYSLIFKRQIVLDICVLAMLYTTRIVAGSVATGIELSVWLIAFAMFFFLSLAAVKRQAELVDMVNRGKIVALGRGYHSEDLPIVCMVGIAAGYISVLVMALYVNSPAVVDLYATPEALWVICCILLYWLTRIFLITHRGLMHDDPIIFATNDRTSQICFIIMLISAGSGAFL